MGSLPPFNRGFKYVLCVIDVLTKNVWVKHLGDIKGCKGKTKKLVDKSDISDLVKNFDLRTKLATLATKAELKADQDKILKLQTHGLSYFLDKNCFGDDGFRNTFVYQPTLDTLELKKQGYWLRY